MCEGAPGELLTTGASPSLWENVSYCSSSASSFVGVVVYQVTAPPPAPGERSFSLSRLIDNVRRGDPRQPRRPPRPRRRPTTPLTPAVTELRIDRRASPRLDVVGEDRARHRSRTAGRVERLRRGRGAAVRQGDEARSRSTRRGADPAHATSPAAAGSARVAEAEGAGAAAGPHRAGSAALKSATCRRLEVDGTRGEATIRQIAGKVDISHRGGEVEIEDVGR